MKEKKEQQCFSSSKSQKKKLFNFLKAMQQWYNNGNKKIANLLVNADNKSLKFATRKRYVINDQNNTDYGDGDENGTTIKFEN